MDITIRPNNDVATLINLFQVKPENQQKLLQLLNEATETHFSKQPGFIAASYHTSKDGRRIVNYGQWRSPKDIEAFRARPEIAEYIKRVKEVAEHEAIVCDVAFVHHC